MEHGNQTSAGKAHYDEHGFTVARQLFKDDEVAALLEHYMRLREQGPHPGDWDGVDADSNDPLARYPRMIHMHRWDETSLNWMLDPRIADWLQTLMGESPYAVQTMLYFKPPGARGQALHQDQYFLRVQPGTCMAAWMALDRCDVDNGCLQVVPGSHRLPLLCTERADTTASFTDVSVSLPEGEKTQAIEMQPGDVLFFNGQLIHGSLPNATPDRFRRSLIGHYIVASAERCADFYHPVLRMDGTEVALDGNEEGGPCGTWVDRGDGYQVEMQQ